MPKADAVVSKTTSNALPDELPKAWPEEPYALPYDCIDKDADVRELNVTTPMSKLLALLVGIALKLMRTELFKAVSVADVIGVAFAAVASIRIAAAKVDWTIFFIFFFQGFYKLTISMNHANKYFLCAIKGLEYFGIKNFAEM